MISRHVHVLFVALLVACSPLGALGQSTEPVKLTVRILDTRQGFPLTGVAVELSGIPERWVTDGDGEISFSAPVGVYVLTARKPGYESLEGDFEVWRAGGVTLRMDTSGPDDPTAPGRLRGTVTDGQTGRPIEGAEILSVGFGPVISDERGRFAFEELEPGSTQLRVRMLGYADRTEHVTVHAGRTTVVQMDVAADPIELAPIKVEVRSRFLERKGVYRRMERGVSNRVVTRDEIERRQSPRLSDSLKGITGLQVIRANQRSVLLGRGRCQLRIYVDGIRMRPDMDGSVDIDQIPPAWVELAEVYSGIASVPPEFAEIRQECGVVLIWSRQRAR